MFACLTHDIIQDFFGEFPFFDFCFLNNWIYCF